MLTKERVSELLEQAEYRFAKTMPQYPHWYTLRDIWIQQRQFEAVVEAIRKYGTEREFLGRTYIYFDVGDWTYWTIGASPKKTVLINKAILKEE